MAYTNYMKDQQTFLGNTKKKIKGRPNRNMIIGASILTYEFIYEPSKTLFTGKIVYDGGDQRAGVRIFKVEKTTALKIFYATSKLDNGAILKLWFATYCEAINSWILCYDHFDYLLGDWVIKEDTQELIRYGDDLLHFEGIDLIRSILEAIIHIHTQGLIHTGLHLTSNYVVLSNKVKIINIGMQSLEDLQTPVDDATTDELRMKDLMGFKDLLEMHILQPGAAWSDRDLFFSFFELTTTVRYNIFIDHLLKHSFLMKRGEERMWSFFKIAQDITDPSRCMQREKLILILASESFEQYLNWDDQMSDELRRVYEYKDEKVPRRHYNGKNVMHLLELLRNAYGHPGNFSIPKLDKIVRNTYSGFLHRIHELLCRLDGN